MTFFDIDLMERRHRLALAERKFTRLTSFGDIGESALDDLSSSFDDKLRTRHRAFLDQITAKDISWISPKLRSFADADFLDDVAAKIRRFRNTTHITERMGSVLTSAGEVFWAIRKPTGLGDLLRSAWQGTTFRLALWHPDDVEGDD